MLSTHSMRGGRHFVEFTVTTLNPHINLGVIRPVSLTDDMGLNTDWEANVNPVIVSSQRKSAVSAKLRSQRTAKWGDSNMHCCAYYCGNGRCYWTDWANRKDSSGWQGSEVWEGNGTVGLLLDLNEGNLSLFKNGRPLGVMKDGLGGEYVWLVSVYSACTISMSRGRAPN